MSQQNDSILAIANKVADVITYCGYACIEEEHLDGLAAALQLFLNSAEIPVHPEPAVAHLRERRTDR